MERPPIEISNLFCRFVIKLWCLVQNLELSETSVVIEKLKEQHGQLVKTYDVSQIKNEANIDSSLAVEKNKESLFRFWEKKNWNKKCFKNIYAPLMQNSGLSSL